MVSDVCEAVKAALDDDTAVSSLTEQFDKISTDGKKYLFLLMDRNLN